MNKPEIKSIIQRIKKGMSTKNDDRILEEMIASGEVNMEDLEDINYLSENLISHLLVDTPSNMDKRFYQMLDNQAKSRRSRIITPRFLSIAASIAILIACAGGFLLYEKKDAQNQALVEQLNQLKEEIVIAKLDDKSTSVRLQAVGLTQEMTEVSQKICDALLFTINNDPSDNVRIASIDALMPYGRMETVRRGLINSIPQQNSPLVLISLAEALKKIGASQSVDQFKNQINKDMPASITETFEKDLHSVLTDKL